jgi:hypothetical protein
MSSMTVETANGGELDSIFNDTEHSHSLARLFAECVAYLDNSENASVPGENATRFPNLNNRG